tara:strand:- start:2313 stop:2576 length:264 start_codon:yes stop_codon:yes gene_type:complete
METVKHESDHTYNLKIYNGRVKVYVDDYVMFTFSQLDFKGYYAHHDDARLYGIDLYLLSGGGATTMEITFEEKHIWLNILALLDKHL